VANRSYLYSTNHLPESHEWEKVRDLHSIAEWNYDIPIVFKLPVRSSIWDATEKIAIAGDFQAGLTSLNEYLSKLPPQAKSLVTEAREFLSKFENERNYFILECGEIFDMEEGSLEGKNQALIEEIKAIGQEIQALVVPSPIIPHEPKRSFLDKLLGRKEEQPKFDPLEPFYDLGLGNWSNILYFQFGEENA